MDGIFASKPKAIEFALIDLSFEDAQILVSNRSMNSVVIDRFQCLMLLPLDKAYFFSERANPYGSIRWPTRDETIGTVIVTYRPPEPFLLKEDQQVHLKLERNHVTPAKPNSLKAGDEAKSFCTIGATSETNTLEVDMAIIEPTDLLSFDSFEVVKLADYSKQQEGDRKALLDRIAKTREDSEKIEE